MGKAGKARKRLRQENAAAQLAGALEQESEESDSGGISNHDLAITLKTLAALGADLAAFRGPRYKPLRAALHPLVEEQLKKAGKVRTEGLKEGSLTNNVSEAIKEQRWEDALKNLAALRAAGAEPKLGSVQRWVRDLDVSGNDEVKLRVLDGVLRAAGQFSGQKKTTSIAVRHPAWVPEIRPATPKVSVALPADFASRFRVVGQSVWQGGVKDSASLPIHYLQPGTITLEGDREVAAYTVPFCDCSYVYTNVLSPASCETIIGAAEARGFTIDPKGPAQFEWLADEALVQSVFDRIKAHLPQELCGDQLMGINARWRIYRYSLNTEYRPHVDGSWPGSGLVDGKYAYDAFGDRRSRLTCVIYLNEDMVGGETGMFTASHEGHLDIQGVQPQVGSVLVFPHGDTRGAVVHEGSAVTSGRKYIIRTEVLYSLKENYRLES